MMASALQTSRRLTTGLPSLSSTCVQCRQRLIQTTPRRTISVSTQNPKHAIRSRLESGFRPHVQRDLESPRRSQTTFAQNRSFSSTSRQCYKSVQEAKARYKLGPFSWQAGLLFLSAGAGLTVYFRYEKERMNRKRITEQSKAVGRPLVGGPFSLIDHDGKPFSEQNMKGKYALVYFGFTNCPDICPEELDKMAGMIGKVKEKYGNVMRPVFISCDPARDTPEVVKVYLKDFHDDIIGLTGEYEQIKQTCKTYRVYFSTPQDVKPGQDYLVDHSIYFYLMDPEGDFVEAIGRNFTVDAAAKVINDHIGDWKGKIDKS